MADNVSQSIKDLNTQINLADQGLKDFNTLWIKLVNDVKTGGADIKSLFEFISQKTNNAKAEKLRLIYEMVDKDGKPLSYNTVKEYVDKLTAARSADAPKVKIGTELVGSEDFTRRINEYKEYLKLLNKTPQQLVAMANSTLGQSLGLNQKESTEYARALASTINKRKKAIDDVARTEGQILKLQQEIGRYKEGSRNWEKTKEKIEAANRELEGYKRKLELIASKGKSILGGDSVDNANLRDEQRYLAWLRERNALMEKNQRARESLQTSMVKGDKYVNSIIGDEDIILGRSKRIAELERKMKESSVELSQKTFERIRAEARRHQESMTEIQRRGHQERLNYTEKALNRESELTRKKDEKEYKAALSQQEKNYRVLRNYLNEKRKLQAQINNQPVVATNEQNTLMAIYNKRINDTVQSMRQLEQAHKGVTAEASKNTMQERLKSVDNTTKQINKNLRQTQTEMTKLLPLIQRVGRAFGLYFSVQGLAQFGKKLIETRGEFEMQFVAMRQILQNNEAATRIWNQTMQLSLQSPFKAMQLTKYTKQLAAYRIETDKLFDTTKRLADVSAGLGVDMQRLILAYGQVKAANYLRASEIRQFTEAGVNILGELSTYLSKTRGEMISTAKVMEMVQKRMVTFADVEAIFKRMTDEGGVFYNMQYVQSQTVRGQIMKLHDAYDQMLNQIGKSSWAIKPFVALLNNIVRNFRMWKTVLDMIAWPLLISSVIKLGRGLFTVGANARLAAGNLRGLEKAGTQLRVSFGKLKKSIQNFAIYGTKGFLGLTAVMTAAFIAWNRFRDVSFKNDEIEEQIRNTYKSLGELQHMQHQIEKNNEAINNPKTSKADKKTAIEKNSEIFAKLQNQYPQVAREMELVKKGTIDMRDAMELYNEELRLNIELQQISKGGLLFDTADENKKDYEDAYNKRLSEIRELIYAAELVRDELQSARTNNENKDQFADIDKKIEKLTELINGYYDAVERGIDPIEAYVTAFERVRSVLTGKMKYILGNGDKAQFKFDYLESNVLKTRKDENGKDIKVIDLGRSERILQENLNEAEFAYERSIVKMAKKIEGFVADENDYLQLTANDFIKKYADQLQPLLYTIEKDGKVTVGKIGKVLGETFLNEAKKVQTPEAQKSLLQKLINTFETSTGLKIKVDENASSSNEQTTPTTTNGTKKTASKLISLIREMRSEYDKLSKSAYGYAKSEGKVRESYKDSVKEILGKAGITDYDFTTNEGMIDALQKVKKYATKLGKDAAAEVQKYIDQLETETEINIQVRIREDFQREIEQMFGDMELSLELKNLSIPSSVLQDMYGMDMVDTADIRAKLNEWYEKMGADRNEEFFKQYQQYIKKLDDEERKQQKQRLKDYSKYLEYQLSERAKLEMEYVHKLSEVQAETAFSATQKKQISDGLRKEYDEAIAKQDWEDFKGSEFYIGMFEDLEKQSTASLNVMKEALLELRKNAKNLSPRAMKELVKDLEKIEEIERDRKPPFMRMREEVEKLNNALGGKNIREVFQDLANKQGERKNLQDKLNLLDAIVGAKQDEIRATEKLTEIEGTKGFLKDAATPQYLESLQRLIRRSEKSLPSHIDTEKNRQKTKELNALKEEAARLEAYLEAKSVYAEVQKILQDEKYVSFKGMSLDQLLDNKDELKKQLKLTDEQISKLETIRDNWDKLKKAEDDALDELKEYISSIGSLISSVTELTYTFGRDNNSLTEYWDNWASVATDSLTQGIDAFKRFKEAKDKAEKAKTANGATEGLLTGDYIKLALVLLGILIQIINKIALFRGARIDKEIEEQQKKIDALATAYERLNKSIERTLDTASYMSDMDKMAENIRQQIAATEAQLAAAQDRKSVDDDEVSGYQKNISDLYDQLEEIQQKQLEVFGGIGKDNYRSWAQGFVDAWKSAFLETGDGLDALQDHFDEFLQEWFVKQATMQIAGKALKGVMGDIDKVVSDDGVVNWNELQLIRDRMATILPDLNDKLTQFAGMWDLEGTGGLSGLAAGIQGMTEEQANVLEAYWNSVRGYTASIDMNVARIADILGANGVNTNPQLEVIARNTSYIESIYNLLNNSQRNEGSGKGFITYSM